MVIVSLCFLGVKELQSISSLNGCNKCRVPIVKPHLFLWPIATLLVSFFKQKGVITPRAFVHFDRVKIPNPDTLRKFKGTVFLRRTLYSSVQYTGRSSQNLCYVEGLRTLSVMTSDLSWLTFRAIYWAYVRRRDFSSWMRCWVLETMNRSSARCTSLILAKMLNRRANITLRCLTLVFNLKQWSLLPILHVKLL